MRHVLTSVLVVVSIIAADDLALGQAPDTGSRVRPKPALVREDLEAWLDGLVPAALRNGDIPGLAVSVVRDGQVLLEKGYGVADVATQAPLEATTVLLAASVSKAFTATAVMQLVEQGRLDLDRDINRYLDFAIPAAFGAPITLRHLLTHTSGFEEIAYKRYRPPQSLRDHVLAVPDRIYPPGTVPAYSNYSLALAGYIVARVSGESFVDYVERHVLVPLGMERSTFRTTLPAALAPIAARNYSVASSPEPFPVSLYQEFAPVEAPASGLSTTAHDMTRFLLAHLGNGRVGEARLLRPETVVAMQSPSFVPIPGAQPVALGLFRTDYRGHRVLGHSGDGEGAHAEMKLLPDQGVGIFIAMNGDGAVNGMFPAAFTLRTRLFEEFVDRYFPTAPVPEEPEVATAKEHARMVAGEYAWSRRSKGDFQEAIALIGRFALRPVIRANPDGTIETEPALAFETGGRTQTWREVGPFVWREIGGDARLLAKVEAGRVVSVWSDQSASFWVNLPVRYLRSARLNVPLLGMAAAVLFLSAASWPLTAVFRRRRGTGDERPVGERRVATLARLAAAVSVLYLFGWALVLAADLASKVGAEPWIRLVQLLGLVVVVGTVVVLWDAWLAWRTRRGGWARVTSVMVALAMVELVWFSFGYHLLSFRLP